MSDVTTRPDDVTAGYETEAAARAAVRQATGKQWPEHHDNWARLVGAALQSGQTLGEHDKRILQWLANYEPTTVEVIARLIEGGNR